MEEIRHTYQYPVDLSADTAPARVIRMVGSGKKVLEVGAGPGSITRHLKHANNCRVTALELDESAIEILTPYCDRVCRANLNDMSWPDLLKDEGRFEVIVAADVLEHLYDPLTVLEQIASFVNDDGYIVISVPHVGHSAIHACMINEDFEYRDWGLLDRTHIRFFGIKNIQALFEAASLKIVHAEFVVRTPEQTEFAERWARLPRMLRQALSINPFGLVYQVVVKAVPATSPGEAITLMDMAAGELSPTDAPLSTRLKTRIRPYLSSDMRARLRGAMHSIGIRV